MHPIYNLEFTTTCSLLLGFKYLCKFDKDNMFRNSTGYLAISKRGQRCCRNNSITANDHAETASLLHQDEQKLAAFAALAFARFRRQVSLPSDDLLHQRKRIKSLPQEKSAFSHRYEYIDHLKVFRWTKDGIFLPCHILSQFVRI